MARSRNIKPGFFTNDVLGELPALTRLLFAGLWTICDRDGRVEDRPKKIRAEVLPYDVCDAEEMLQALEKTGFISRYEASGTRVIQVLTWGKHQNPHVKEAASLLPPPGGFQPPPEAAPDKNSSSTGQAPDDAQPLPALAGLIPDSLSSDSLSSDSLSSDSLLLIPKAHPTAGQVCIAMRQAGMQSVNPSSPKLIALLEAGITLDELVYSARDAVERGKPFAYALIAAEGRRRDAATPTLPPARASPTKNTHKYAGAAAAIFDMDEPTNHAGVIDV